MTIQLYVVPVSPPVRAVQMTAKALGINLELKPIDMMKGEHRSPEYLKMNPQHTVPVINDNGLILVDSHAINAYLVSKYAKNDSLYPKDIEKRAIVDHRLHFDSSVLFPKGIQIISPIFRGFKKTLEPDQINLLLEAYEFLEKFLEGSKWIAGDSVTIADYSIYNSLSSMNIVVPVTSIGFPKLSNWLKKVDALPESEVTKPGLKMAADIINRNMGKL